MNGSTLIGDGEVIRTKAGTAVRIIRKLPPFRCSGQEIERVEIENIDKRSVTFGNITDINLYELTEGRMGEIEEAVGGVG